MDFWTSVPDIFFLLLALAIIPLTRHVEPLPPSTSVPPSPFPRNGNRATSSGSPLSSPRFDSLTVPTITITPDHTSLLQPASGGGGRPTHLHKRKTVSFSLSSMDELITKGMNGAEQAGSGSLRKRPPTPFVSGPVSPAATAPAARKAEEEGSVSGGESPMASVPGTPVGLSSLDPMGVQKKWLMA